MHTGEKVLEAYVAGALYKPVTVHFASLRLLRGNGLCNLCDAYARHLAFTYDQPAESGTVGCISSWWLVSPRYCDAITRIRS